MNNMYLDRYYLAPPAGELGCELSLGWVPTESSSGVRSPGQLSCSQTCKQILNFLEMINNFRWRQLVRAPEQTKDT